MTWFDTARFGMFVHWGHSSQQGIELSWPLVGAVFALPLCGVVPVEEYHASAATFNPTAWDPKALAATAKRAGMQYAVLTTKHHDGYAMFDTKTSDFGVMHSPYGKDITRGFFDAMRAEGIRVGVYFSLIDWHHPDYPAFRQADQPYQFPQGVPADPARWPKFIDVMFAQVRELLTNYGKIDVIWFDGGWERTPEQWKAKELEAMIRELQPDILINDRLPGAGDYLTPEQFVPAQPLPRPWETCMTINESWGYNPRDTRFKSARKLIHTLCEVAGAAAISCSTLAPMGDGHCRRSYGAPRRRSSAGWRRTPRASSGRRRRWTRGSSTARRPGATTRCIAPADAAVRCGHCARRAGQAAAVSARAVVRR